MHDPHFVDYIIQSIDRDEYFSINCPLLGNYQSKNILTAIAATSLLNSTGWSLSKKAIETGLMNVISNTGIRGRWERLSDKPLVICDTAHNPDGLKGVMEQIQHTPHGDLHIVLGVVGDKEISKILSLLPQNAIYYFCKADIPRGLPVEILKNLAQNIGLIGMAYVSVSEAYTAALKAANPDDLVFIGGSTFVVAEVL
jgi:dihydrofolate synthase/folylpolyglutamate synthase